MKPLEFRNDKVPELDISRLEVIIDDDDVKVPLLLSVFHFRRRSTKSFAKKSFTSKQSSHLNPIWSVGDNLMASELYF